MSISLANNYSYEGIQNLQAQREAKNLLAETYNNAISTQGFASKVNIASDLAMLGEKGRQFNDKINQYAQKVNKPAVAEVVKKPLEGDGVESGKDSRGIMSKALGISEETASKVGKFGTRAMMIGTAGIDIAEDIEKGGIQGENWEQKAENIGNIAGGVLETAGLILPGIAPELELGGAIVSGIGDIIGDIGDFIDNHAKTDDLKKKQSTLPAPKTPSTSLAGEGQILTTKVK